MLETILMHIILIRADAEIDLQIPCYGERGRGAAAAASEHPRTQQSERGTRWPGLCKTSARGRNTAANTEQNLEERVAGIAQTWYLELRYLAVNDVCGGDKHRTPQTQPAKIQRTPLIHSSSAQSHKTISFHQQNIKTNSSLVLIFMFWRKRKRSKKLLTSQIKQLPTSDQLI